MTTSILWVGKGTYYLETLRTFYDTLQQINDSTAQALNALSAISLTLKTKFNAIYIEDEIYPGPKVDGPLTEFDKREPRNSYKAILQIRNHTKNRETKIYVIKTPTTDTKKFLEAGASGFINIDKIYCNGLEKLLLEIKEDMK